MPERQRMSLSRKLSVVIVAALVGAGGNFAALLWSVNDARDERRDICEKVRESNDKFADVLISSATRERTPEEQAAFDAQAQAFRDDVSDILADCS